MGLLSMARKQVKKTEMNYHPKGFVKLDFTNGCIHKIAQNKRAINETRENNK